MVTVYARPSLDKQRLGQLIDMVSNIVVGDEDARSKDVLGRVYAPCCGSSGMFVQSVAFTDAHATGNGGNARGDISIWGEESNHTTWRFAQMNLAIRGIEGQIAHGDSFHNDRHPDLRADFNLVNPPFNVSGWGDESAPVLVGVLNSAGTKDPVISRPVRNPHHANNRPDSG